MDQPDLTDFDPEGFRLAVSGLQVAATRLRDFRNPFIRGRHIPQDPDDISD